MEVRISSTAAIIVFIVVSLVHCVHYVHCAQVKLTGKRMEVKLRENKTYFTGGAIVHHSSFTVFAEEMVHFGVTDEVRMAGALKMSSIDGTYSIAGDKGHYSIKYDTGTVQGLPAMAFIKIDGDTAQLTSKRIYYGAGSINAYGDAILDYKDYRISAPSVSYELNENEVFARPLEQLSINSERHSAKISAGELIFSADKKKLYLVSEVKGAIWLK